jgi:hypothetical protein
VSFRINSFANLRVQVFAVTKFEFFTLIGSC